MKIQQLEQYKDAKANFKLDAESIEVEGKDVGDIHRLDEYRFIGKLRLKLIFIPFLFVIYYFRYKYEYMVAFCKCITIIQKSDLLLKLFSIYNIKIRKKYGYLAFVANYRPPEEFNEAHIPHSTRQHLIVQHFQDTSLKLFDDVTDSEIADLLNIDSLSNPSMMELHLEPIGMYECIALKELKLYMILSHLAYLTIFASIILYAVL